MNIMGDFLAKLVFDNSSNVSLGKLRVYQQCCTRMSSTLCSSQFTWAQFLFHIMCLRLHQYLVVSTFSHSDSHLIYGKLSLVN